MSLDGRRSSTRTAPRASSICRSTGLGAAATDTTCAGREMTRHLGADRHQDGVAIGRIELVGLVEDEVKRLAAGHEPLDGGDFRRAQILIDHEHHAVRRRGARHKRRKMPVVAVDRPGIDQAHDVARLGCRALVACTRAAMRSVLPA